VAYLNLDVAATGNSFHASASPTIKQLFREVSMDVKDPTTGKSVYDLWRGAQKLPNKEDQVKLGDLGGGSDFAGFINHLGITSSEHGFGGGGGVYHSAYDDYYYMSHFGDPGFKYTLQPRRLLESLHCDWQTPKSCHLIMKSMASKSSMPWQRPEKTSAIPILKSDL